MLKPPNGFGVQYRWSHRDGSRLVWRSGGTLLLAVGPSGGYRPVPGVWAPADAHRYAMAVGFQLRGRKPEGC